MTIIFQALKHTVGLRVSAEEEIEGLDSKEHGLTSAYDGFVVHDTMTVPTPMGVTKATPSANTSANVAPAEVADTIPELPREGVHKRNRCYRYYHYKRYGMWCTEGCPLLLPWC